MTFFKSTYSRERKPFTHPVCDQTSSAMLARIVCILVLSHALPASAAVYKSIDSDGNIIFTDTPRNDSTIVEQKPPVVINSQPTADKQALEENAKGGNTPSSENTPENANTTSSSLPTIPAELMESEYVTEDARDKPPATKLPHISELDLDLMTEEELDLLTESQLAILVKRKEAKDELEKNRVLEDIYEYDVGAGLGETVQHTADPADLPKDEFKPITQSEVPITFVEIASPAHDATLRDPKGKIWVQLKTHPKSLKQSGLSAELWMNGRLVSKGKRSMLGLPTPNRGSHELQIKLVNSVGEVELKSAPSMIHVKRFIEGR